MNRPSRLIVASLLATISCSSFAAISSHDFYLKALGGIAQGKANSLNSVEPGHLSFSNENRTEQTSSLFGAALGYTLPTSPFSLELQALHINKQGFQFTTQYPKLKQSELDTLQVSSNVYLLNVLYHLPAKSNLDWFIGGGIGLADNQVGGQFTSYSKPGFSGVWTSQSQTNFSYNLTAGMGYQLSSHLDVSLAYQYLSLGKLATGTKVYGNDGTSGIQTLSANQHSLNNIVLGISYHI